MSVFDTDALSDEEFARWLETEQHAHRLQSIEFLEHDGIFVTSASPCVVELLDHSFVLVKEILHNAQAHTYQVRGLPMKRVRESEGLLDAKRNEVFLDITYINQAAVMTIIEPRQIIDRKPTIFTNLSREAFAAMFPQEARAIRRGDTLICRCKQVKYTFTISTGARTKTKWRETSIQRLNQKEGDILSHLFSVPNRSLKDGFREADIINLDLSCIDLTEEPRPELLPIKLNNDSIKTSSPSPNEAESELASQSPGSEDLILISDDEQEGYVEVPLPSMDLTSHTQGSEDLLIISDDEDEGVVEVSFCPQPENVNPPEKLSASVEFVKTQIVAQPPARPHYTIGDAFCGGGGISRGAIDAGLKIRWAFDAAPEMCTTYARNFCTDPGSFKVVNTDAFSFLTDARYGSFIDILHLSPPCQFFSPAHTRPGSNDDANTAASFCIIKFLERFRPRLVTLENTKGLPQGHQDYLAGVINQFTSVGYNVRWKVVHMADYGIPQTRERLIILASCPGEPLPQFPPPTHSRDTRPNSKPWRTINSVLANIPRDANNHKPQAEPRINKDPYSGETQARTILTGTFDYHPSGKRQFTIRELASLQGFPLNHVFPASLTKTMIRKQIGNAVPPLFAKRLYTHLRKALEREDGY